MLKLSRLLSIVTLLFASGAFADIRDRIDTCENRGGANGCVYDLLRELSDQSRPADLDRIVTGCACQTIYESGGSRTCDLIYTRNNITRNTIEEKTLLSWTYACEDSGNAQACKTRLANTTLCK